MSLIIDTSWTLVHLCRCNKWVFPLDLHICLYSTGGSKHVQGFPLACTNVVPFESNKRLGAFYYRQHKDDSSLASLASTASTASTDSTASTTSTTSTTSSAPTAKLLQGPYVYVLLLQEQKYYVGFSKNKDGCLARINDHFTAWPPLSLATSSAPSSALASAAPAPVKTTLNLGAKWTQIYKPISVLEVFTNGSLTLEKQVAIQYIRKHGIENVRGGPWSRIDLKTKDFMPSQQQPSESKEPLATYRLNASASREETWQKSFQNQFHQYVFILERLSWP